MPRVLARVSTALVSSLLAAAVASPAYAEDPLPEGCAGSVVYACTGDATPIDPIYVATVPIDVTTPGVPLLPGQTVGGQQIGGVLIAVPGQSVDGFGTTVGGPTDPFPVLVTPVAVCAFVVCVPAGIPVVVPGLPLPVVPVNVPDVVVPGQAVTVPALTPVPATSTPSLGIPPFNAATTHVTVYKSRDDIAGLAGLICAAGLGQATWWYDASGQPRFNCPGGFTNIVANVFYTLLT